MIGRRKWRPRLWRWSSRPALGSPGRFLRGPYLRRLLAVDRKQHFLLARRLLGLLGGLGRLLLAEARAKRVHQVDHVADGGPRLCSDGLAVALLVDEVNQRRFIVVLELLGLELPGLRVDDVLGEIEHFLGDFDVLDLVKIFT